MAISVTCQLFISVTFKQSNLLASPWFQVLVAPTRVKWLHLLTAGAMLRVLWEFTYWTFNILYGIDLWDTLTVQRFEPEIESWADFPWHRATFLFPGHMILTAPQPGLLERDLLMLPAALPRRILQLVFVCNYMYLLCTLHQDNVGNLILDIQHFIWDRSLECSYSSEIRTRDRILGRFPLALLAVTLLFTRHKVNGTSA